MKIQQSGIFARRAKKLHADEKRRWIRRLRPLLLSLYENNKAVWLGEI